MVYNTGHPFCSILIEHTCLLSSFAHTRISFYSYGDKLLFQGCNYCLALASSTQERQLHRTSVFSVSIEGPAQLVTFYDQQSYRGTKRTGIMKRIYTKDTIQMHVHVSLYICVWQILIFFNHKGLRLIEIKVKYSGKGKHPQKSIN